MLDIANTDLNFPDHEKHPDIDKNGLIRVDKEIDEQQIEMEKPIEIIEEIKKEFMYNILMIYLINIIREIELESGIQSEEKNEDFEEREEENDISEHVLLKIEEGAVGEE